MHSHLCFPALPILALTLALAALPGIGQANCDHRITLHNTGAHPLRVVTESVRVRGSDVVLQPTRWVFGLIRTDQVRVWLPWRRARAGGWMTERAELVIPANGTRVSTYRAHGACHRVRQVEVPYSCAAGPRGGRDYVQRWGIGANTTVPLDQC